MKRILTTIIIIVLMAACAVMMISYSKTEGGNAVRGVAGNGSVQVVATIFPEYDWAREIAGKDNKDDVR